MFAVVITEKGGAQRRLDFDKNEVTIGRVQGNDIILPKGNVSKRHSRIVLKDNRFIVVDLKSTNGTYVNGRKITSPLVVKSGDKIYIGDFILTLEETGAGAAAAPPEPAMSSPAAMSPPPMQPVAPMPQPVAPAPVHGGHAQAAHAPPPMQQPMQAPPAMQQPMQAPPPMQPMQAAPAAQQAVADRRPPPLRSAPPPPRPGTLVQGGGAAGAAPAPPPLPARPLVEPPRPQPPESEAPPQDRYALDEEPADETMSPSPRVVAAARPMTPGSRPGEGPRPEQARPLDPPRLSDARGQDARAPEPRAHAEAPRAPEPVRTELPSRVEPRAEAPISRPHPTHRPQRRGLALARPRDSRDPLAHALAIVAESFDVTSPVPPESAGDERWREARAAVDGAIERLEREGFAGSFDRDQLAAAALHEAAGLGALAPLLEEPGLLEIVVEGPSRVLVDRGSGLVETEARFSSVEMLLTALSRLFARGGQYLDSMERTIAEASLPDGTHVSVVLPPTAVRGPFAEIRRTGRPAQALDALVAQGLLTGDMAGVLRRAVTARRNVVVMGPAEHGVPQLVSALANLTQADERVLAIEASPELALGNNGASRSAVRLVCSPGVDLRALLAHGARVRCDRLVVDGATSADVHDALVALSSRGGGALLGVRAAPMGAPHEHLAALARLAGAGDVAGLVAAAHVIVTIERREGVRRVTSIGEVGAEGYMALFENGAAVAAGE